jgi:hypothetical protein
MGIYMKKSYPVLIILAAFILLFSLFYFKSREDLETPEQLLVKSFETSGAGPLNKEMYFWAPLDESYNNFDEISNLAYYFKNCLADNILSLDENIVKTDTLKQIELNGSFTGNAAINISGKKFDNGNGVFEQSFSVNITGNFPNDVFVETRDVLMEAFKSKNLQPRLSSCFTGFYEGKMSEDEVDDILGRVFSKIDAKEVDGVDDSGLKSVTAYSPAISNYMRIGGSKVNINLAVRYNSYEDRTYIWIGTPVITTEY